MAIGLKENTTEVKSIQEYGSALVGRLQDLLQDLEDVRDRVYGGEPSPIRNSSDDPKPQSSHQLNLERAHAVTDALQKMMRSIKERL